MSSKPLEIILAATPLGEIGFNNTIPWRLKGDLRRFKDITMGNIVIMGKNTWESIKGPLEGRTVIVVSASLAELTFKKNDTFFVNNLAEAFAICNSIKTHDEKIIIAGGVALYTAAFMFPCTVHLTTVYKKSIHGYDAVIPNFDMSNFDMISEPIIISEVNSVTNLVEISHAYTTYRSKNYNQLIGA